MKNKSVSSQQVFPAQCGRPEAEIVLFAVAFPEGFDIKQTDFNQTIAANIHAESDCRGYFYVSPAVGACKSGVKALRGFFIGQFFHAVQRWIIANRGVAGKRGHAAYSCGRICMHRQPVKPVVRNFCVAVQQYDIIGIGQGHSQIYCRGKSEIFRILNKNYARGGSQASEVLCNFGFGTCIINEY